MTELVWDMDSPPARMQLGADSGPGFSGGEYLEAGLGNAQLAGEKVCPFKFVDLI